MLSSLRIRRLTVPVVIGLSLAVSACSDDPAAPEPEPEVQVLSLTVGANTITINKTTGVPSGSLTVPAGASTVTATWKKADNTDETLITSAEFDLKITPTTPANLAWVASGAFGGTLTTTGLASNATTPATVSLFHKGEQHDDFGPYNITIRVQ